MYIKIQINKWTNVVIIGVVSIYAGVSSNAEEICADPSVDVELVPYTAVSTRTPLPLDKVSPSISYISEAEIVQNQDRSIVDVLERQPGVVINTTGTKGALSSLFIRGTNSDHTGFFLDGRRLNPGFANLYDLEFLSIDNLSSVELQRGSSSVNYGSSGIGGVVSLQTRSSLGEETKTGSVEAEYGSYDTYRGAFSTSFADENRALSLGSSVLTTENKRSNDDFETFNLNGRFENKITDYLVAELVSFITKSNKELPNTITNPSNTDFSEIDSWLISPGLRYQKGDWSGHAFYSKSKQVLNRELVFGESLFKSKSIVESDELYLQVDYSGIENVLASAGTLYRNDEAKDAGLFFLERFEQIGLWTQVQLQLTDSLEVRLGGRYDEYSDFDASLNGSIEVLYLFPDLGTTLFAKLATSYAPPSAQDIAFDSDPIASPLNPEESISYEVGLRQQLFDRKLELSTIVFRNEIENLIDFVGLDALNVNRAKTEGIEFSAQYKPAEILDLGISYTYLTALDNETDKRLLRRPRHVFQASAWLKPIEKLDLGLRATGYFDREDAIFLPDFTRIQVDQEDYFIVDALVDYSLVKHLTVFARVENLLDEDYESVLGYPALGRAGYVGVRFTF